jgi:hypothetical protein
VGWGRLPPHRSQRAALRHWALASDASVEPLGGPWVQDAGGWELSFDQQPNSLKRYAEGRIRRALA